MIKCPTQKHSQGVPYPAFFPLLNRMKWILLKPNSHPFQMPHWYPLNNALPTDRTNNIYFNRFSTGKYRLHGSCPSLMPGNYEFFNNPFLLFILCYSVNIFCMRNALARHFMKLFYNLLNSKVSPCTTPCLQLYFHPFPSLGKYTEDTF